MKNSKGKLLNFYVLSFFQKIELDPLQTRKQNSMHKKNRHLLNRNSCERGKILTWTEPSFLTNSVIGHNFQTFLMIRRNRPWHSTKKIFLLNYDFNFPLCILNPLLTTYCYHWLFNYNICSLSQKKENKVFRSIISHMLGVSFHTFLISLA